MGSKTPISLKVTGEKGMAFIQPHYSELTAKIY